MKTMKPLLLALPVSIAFFAAAPAAQAADAPRYNDLPAGHITTAPKGKIPAAIGANEKVEGMYAVEQNFGKGVPVHQRHVMVLGDPKMVESIKSGRGFARDESDTGACFIEAGRSRRMMMGLDDEDEDTEREWGTGQMYQVNLWPKHKDNPSSGVAAVHSERLVDKNGVMTLESTDAWVDPSSKGMRLISRAQLPLALVGSAIGGVKVYAGRDDRDGKKQIQFVVVRGSTSAQTGSTMMGTRQDGTSSHGSGCGHLRMTLAVGGSNGDAGVVVAPVELPSLESPDADKKEKAEAADKAKEPAAAVPAPTPVRLKKRFRGPPRPPTVRGADEGEMGTPPPEPKERELRARDMEVHLSVSQTSRDRQPVLAVSFGWTGRETVQRVFE